MGYIVTISKQRYSHLVCLMDKSDKIYLERIGKNIAKARKKNKLKQVDVCAELKMDKPYLSSIENGRQNPTLLTLKKLADAIGVDVEVFLHCR